MDRSAFHSQENWHGTSYELAIELQPSRDTERLMRATRRLWMCDTLTGTWPGREQFGCLLGRAPPPDPIPLYGVLKLDGGCELGCLSDPVQEEAGSDWLSLRVPTGMLEQVFPVQYPLAEATNPWLSTLDEGLLRIAASLDAEIPFEMAIVGEEVAGRTHAAELRPEDVTSGFLLPYPLWHRLRPPAKPRVLSHNLHFLAFRD